MSTQEQFLLVIFSYAYLNHIFLIFAHLIIFCGNFVVATPFLCSVSFLGISCGVQSLKSQLGYFYGQLVIDRCFLKCFKAISLPDLPSSVACCMPLALQ